MTLSLPRHAGVDVLTTPLSLKYSNSIKAKQGLPQAILRLKDSNSPVGLFWVNVKAFALFTRMFGAEAASQVLQRLAEILEQTGKELLPQNRFLMVERVDRGSLAVFFQNGPLNLDMLIDHALELRVAAQDRINQEVVQLTGHKVSLEMGCAMVSSVIESFFVKDLYRALEDAAQMAMGALDAQRLSLIDEFRQLVGRPRLYSLYQPVVNLAGGSIMGWEALARGPKSGHFHSPKAMFDFAEEVGALFQLEKCCRQQALAGLGGLGQEQKLFLNIHPKTLGDPEFRSGQTRRLLGRHGLKPSQVVFEITERHSIKDFALFHRTLGHYRQQGFLVAIDDAGTGFSGLNRIARLRPDFIKADMGLVQGVASNPVQRALLETLVIFADKIGCALIAEGIEDETDLSCLVNAGVHYGQGYFLGMPCAPKADKPLNAIPKTVSLGSNSHSWKCSLPIRQLVEPAPEIAPQTKVKKVKELLDNHPLSGAVVVRNNSPVGLVMSHNLDRQLGTQYGSALYYERPVELLMDRRPLVVEASTPVEQVARESTKRERFKLFDHIVVIEGNRCLGMVSVQKMLDSMARVQVEMAKGSNPLTGLPGGLALEMEIERRCSSGSPSSLIYVDLDHFKIYNDLYGFKAGNNMIGLTGDILRWACHRHDGETSFVGHIGGDDFVMITQPQSAQRVCLAVVRCFKRLVRTLYQPDHLQKGMVEARGRDGKPGRFPLVSISLGIVDCPGQGCDLLEITRRAAEIKQYAKSLPGCVFVRDRRRVLGDGKGL